MTLCKSFSLYKIFTALSGWKQVVGFTEAVAVFQKLKLV